MRESYIWLLVSVGLTCWAELSRPDLAGAARHALGSGFILTMIMGMGLRMIPAFETKRLLWKQGPWLVLGLVSLGTALRVWAQGMDALDALAVGGALQFLAVLMFVALLVGTYLFGTTVSCEAEVELFKDRKSPAAVAG